MKRIFLFLFAALLSVVAHAQPMAVPIHTQFAGYVFDDQSPATKMEVDLNWETAPASGWGTYAQFWTTFQAGSGAYMGMQKDDAGKKILFSVWDPSPNHKVRPYALSHCRRFDHEGNGGQCIMRFEWKSGVKYKLVMGLIAAQPGDVGFARWGGWLIDTSTGVTTFIGGYEVPNYNGLNGQGLINPGSILTVFEYYLAPANVQCNSLPYGSLIWTDLMVNGVRKSSNAFARYDTGITDCKNSDYVRTYSKGKGSVTQTTGMVNVSRAAEGAWLWNEATAPTTPTQPATPTLPTTPVTRPPAIPEQTVLPTGTPWMLLAERDRVACTYYAINRHFRQFFHPTEDPFVMSRPWAENYIYMQGDFIAKSQVYGLFYDWGGDKKLKVLYMNGRMDDLGPMADWIALAGC